MSEFIFYLLFFTFNLGAAFFRAVAFAWLSEICLNPGCITAIFITDLDCLQKLLQ